MNRLKHTVVLELPTDYEHVLVSLWKLGLDRDPVKYTLRELKVVFHYDTSEEHQMIRMIKSSDTLMFALISLHQMIAPPYSIANVLREKISSGCYNTADEFYADIPNPDVSQLAFQNSLFAPRRYPSAHQNRWTPGHMPLLVAFLIPGTGMAEATGAG